ncbi:unnamed protein product [Adineta steineri]|uniref:Uncharacterized protein n=1 Tax=Adineta steineri TaxID=433720 RepID=A0A814M1K9_9BILA|nr:unnamed protein product [Adineta steineri]CAF1322591.1 unnamed protein product [Adineta steineri]
MNHRIIFGWFFPFLSSLSHVKSSVLGNLYPILDKQNLLDNEIIRDDKKILSSTVKFEDKYLLKDILSYEKHIGIQNSLKSSAE